MTVDRPYRFIHGKIKMRMPSLIITLLYIYRSHNIVQEKYGYGKPIIRCCKSFKEVLRDWF